MQVFSSSFLYSSEDKVGSLIYIFFKFFQHFVQHALISVSETSVTH